MGVCVFDKQDDVVAIGWWWCKVNVKERVEKANDPAGSGTSRGSGKAMNGSTRGLL